jgi:hypothetical protein
LVKKKLDKTFPDFALKGSVFIDRLKTGRSDWNFMFAACSVAPPLSNWLEFALDQQNPFKALYFLPIEVEALIKSLHEVFFPEQKTPIPSFFSKKAKDEKDSKDTYQLLVVHNKVGGIRQVAFKNNRILFTRLITIPPDESASFIAGSIDQEIINSGEYLKRLSAKDSMDVDVYIIASPEIKENLLKMKLRGKNVTVLTPYETSQKLNLSKVAANEDRFSDVLIAAVFSQNKPILPLYTPTVQKLSILELIHKFSLAPIALVLPIALIFTLINQYNIYLVRNEVKIKLTKKEKLQKEYSDIETSAGSINEATKIKDIVTLYQLLSGNNLSPLSIISGFIEIATPDVIVKSFKWNLADNITALPGHAAIAPGSVLPPQTGGAEVQNKEMANAIFEIEFSNLGEGYQELFENFDKFIQKVKKRFANYTIEYSRAEESISFNEVSKVIPVRITMVGPHATNNQGN